MARNLEDLIETLTAFDLSDLAAGLGGLQLLPANLERQLRFELASSIIASLEPKQGQPSMSALKWKQLLNGSPIGGGENTRNEDPAEDAFTASMSFIGGPYVVFKGIATGSVEVARLLFEAVFLLPGLPDTYVKEMEPLVFAALRLSNATALRAGLRRDILPVSGPNNLVQIPSMREFVELKEAVTFTPERLSMLCAPFSPDALNPLIIDAGSIGPYAPPQEMGDARLYSTPFLRVGGCLFLLMPSAILVALRHRMITRALELGLRTTLASSYRFTAAKEVYKSLDLMGFVQQPVKLEEEPPWALETLWTFDVDKLAHVLVISDDFDGYADGEAFGHWEPGWDREVEDRLLRMRQLIRSNAETLDGVLHLIVVQGVGRIIAFGLTDRVREAGAYVLLTSQPDLALIGRMEVADPLALWKFSKARDRVSKRSNLFHVGGSLDEYALYHAKDHSFYLSDDELPNLIYISPDMAAKLRHEDISKFDFHGVPSWGARTITNVQRRYPGSAIPIYTREPASFRRVEFFVEGLEIPVWVFEGNEQQQSVDHSAFETCEAVAYWMWQLSPWISGLFRVLADCVEQIGIEVCLEHVHGLEAGDAIDRPDNWLETRDLGRGLVKLNFGLGTARALSGATNEGERHLVASIVHVLQEKAERMTGLDVGLDTQRILNECAPLGPKKKLISLDGAANIELTKGSLPPVRLVQDADVAFLLDDLGPQVSSALSLEVSSITPDRKVEVLNESVTMLFSNLESSVAELSYEGLLERLMMQYESLVHATAEARLLLPTRLACFGSDDEYIKDNNKRSQDLIQASLANRFLIEYVAACPPAGRRRLSRETLDQLMALAAEIIDKGMLSDFVKYGLADIELSILPSGRLGISREGRFALGMQKFKQIKAREDVESAISWFERHWPAAAEVKDEPSSIAELDSAFRAEFGFTVVEMFNVFFSAISLGRELETEPVVRPLEEVIEALRRPLDATPENVRDIVEAFALRPRSTFIPTDKASEVFPWRFSRELSYLRRPFVIRLRNDREEILWGIRHLEVSRQNILSLIHGGRLKARAPEMKHYMSRMRIEESEAFNEQVADCFRQQNNDLVVRTRVYKINSMRIEEARGEPLGDIDVLVVNSRQRRIVAVETKDFELARTPFELSNELTKLFLGENSATAHHRKRVQWLERHIHEVLHWAGMKDVRHKWRVDALIVVSRTLITPYIERSQIKVMSLEELQESLGSTHS